jgi:prepilin-type N-terminal cleavage/methylation domain-containing protein
VKDYINIWFGSQKDKNGFTLIELLIVIVILAILTGVVIMAVGGVFGTTKDTAYQVTKDELKNAVEHYSSENPTALPNASLFDTNVLNPRTEALLCDAGNGSCYVIDIDTLLVSAEPSGILGSVPESASPDNCAGCTGSYTWLMDNLGNIYSACTNDAACEDQIATDVNGNYYDEYCNPTYP